MAVKFKIPEFDKLSQCQFFQVPVACGLLAGFEVDQNTRTLYAKESQIVIPSMHGFTHVAEDPVPDATCDTHGLMSPDDKCKLDSMLQMRIGILGYQGAGFCLTPDIKILMSDGSQKAIKDIVEGEMVISHTGTSRKVTKTYNRKINEKIIAFQVNGKADNLKLTKEHKIYASKKADVHKMFKWIPAGELEAGDFILDKSKNFQEIMSKIEYLYDEDVYDISVDVDNSMIANGLIVHNSDDGGQLSGDVIFAAGSEFIGIERIGNTVRFTVDIPTSLSCSCFPGDARVLLDDGTVKPIKDIKEGDLVITHNGFIKQVTKHLVRHFKGELVEMDVVGHNKFLVTPDHPIYSINEKIVGKRKNALKSVGLLKDSDEDWILAGQLEKNDFISRRFSHNIIKNIEKIDLLKEIPNCLEKDGLLYPSRKYCFDKTGSYCKSENKIREVIGIDGFANGVPRFIKIDADFLKLLGYFLAEGCYSERNGIRFSINRAELQSGDIGADIMRIMRDKFGLEGIVYGRKHIPHGVDIYYRSKILGRFLLKTCGAGAKTKKIADWVLQLSPDLTLNLLAGFFKGDGYISRTLHGEHELKIEMPNENLVSQLSFIADKSNLNIRRPNPRLSCGFGKDKKNRSLNYRLNIAVSHAPKLYELITGIEPVVKPKIFNFIKTEEGVLTEIRSVKRVPYDGLVYNLEVEGEHTYVVNGLSVHNCESCAQIFFIQDTTEINKIRPPACNGKMPGITIYDELKIYTLPENTIVDSRNPDASLANKGNYPSLIFKRYDNALTPYENEFSMVLKRNSNLTTNVGWHMTPGPARVTECVWYAGNMTDGRQISFELLPETTPGLLGMLLFNGNLITKRPAVITDYTPNVLKDNLYILRKWDINNANPIGDTFTARNVWRYQNPENSFSSTTDPKTLILDSTINLLPIGTLVDIYEFEISRSSTGRIVRSFFIKEPNLNPEQLWSQSDAVRFGDLLTARDEINNPISGTALSASEIDVADVRLLERTQWGLTDFEDRLFLTDDGKVSLDSAGNTIYEPSGMTINNDIVADIDYAIPGLKILKQDRPLTGDVNSDGKVDETDLKIFACAYGSKVGDPNYNAQCDFNEDGKVDVRDLVVIAQHFDIAADKVIDRACFLWHRHNHRNFYWKAQIGMPLVSAQVFPPYDFLLDAPVDSFDDIYMRVIKRGIISVGPFAGAPYIVVKGMRWKDIPQQGVLRILTGAYRNIIWRYYFKAAFADFDDDAIMLIGREVIYPFDEDFQVRDLASACTYPGTEGSESGVSVPTNTTVVELLHQDYTAPAIRFQFDTNYSSGSEAVQLQVIVGILDMSVAYPFATVNDPRDDYVRGFSPGYTVSRVFVQQGFISDGKGIGVVSIPPEFRVYTGGELPAPVQGETEKWNDVEILYKDGQLWLWWNSMLVSPDTILSSQLPSPVAVTSPYFPLRTLSPIGKCAMRLWPGSVVRSTEVRDQTLGFSEFTRAQMAIES